MAKKNCECCGAPLVEYKHGLSKGLARGLYRIAQAGGGPINANELNLNYNQQSNFQKLRYWDLVEKSDPESAKGGRWNLTEIGQQFVRGEIELEKFAISYRGEIVRHEGVATNIRDITDGWWYRPDYAEQSTVHT